MRLTSSFKGHNYIYIYIYIRFKGYEIIRWCWVEGGGEGRK